MKRARRGPKTEAAAWRMVAKGIERAEKMPDGNGLCSEMCTLLGRTDHPKQSAWSYDNKRTQEHVDASTHDYLDPAHWTSGEDWEARCLAAYWLALECEEEERDKRSLLRWRVVFTETATYTHEITATTRGGALRIAAEMDETGDMTDGAEVDVIERGYTVDIIP